MSNRFTCAFGVCALLLSACGSSGTSQMTPQMGGIDPAEVVTTSSRGFAVPGETISNMPDDTVFEVELRRIDGVGQIASGAGTLTVLAPISNTVNSARELLVTTPEVVTTVTGGINQLTGENAAVSPFNGLENVGAFRVIFTDPSNDQILDYGVYGTSTDPVELQPLTGRVQYDTTVFLTLRETDAAGDNVAVFESNGIGTVALTADFGSDSIDGQLTLTAINGPEADNLRGSVIAMDGDLSSGNIFDGTMALPAGGSGTALDQVAGSFDGAFYGPNGSEIGGLMQGTMGTSATDNTITFVGAFTGEQ